jgi:hypothetical protein
MGMFTDLVNYLVQQNCSSYTLHQTYGRGLVESAMRRLSWAQTLWKTESKVCGERKHLDMVGDHRSNSRVHHRNFCRLDHRGILGIDLVKVWSSSLTYQKDCLRNQP